MPITLKFLPEIEISLSIGFDPLYKSLERVDPITTTRLAVLFSLDVKRRPVVVLTCASSKYVSFEPAIVVILDLFLKGAVTAISTNGETSTIAGFFSASSLSISLNESLLILLGGPPPND